MEQNNQGSIQIPEFSDEEMETYRKGLVYKPVDNNMVPMLNDKIAAELMKAALPRILKDF